VNRNKRINLSNKHANSTHDASNKQTNDDIELGDLKTCKTQANEQDMSDDKQFDTSNDLNDNSNNNNNSFNQKELLDVVLMKKKSKFNRKSSIASDSSVVISMLNKSASNTNNNNNNNNSTIKS